MARWSMLPFFLLVMGGSASAVPPPPPRQANLLSLKANGCPISVTGSAKPYSPETYQFAAKVDDVLVMVNPKPDLHLVFDLGMAGEVPWIADAGFGPDVRIRLPRAGNYELDVSGFDPIAGKAVSIEFRLSLSLRDQGPIDLCPSIDR